MPTKINSWLANKLQITDPPPPIDLVVQVEYDRLAEVTQVLQGKGYIVQAEAFNFILVRAVPPDEVAVLSEIPGIIRVSYNAPVKIGSLLPQTLALLPGLTIQDPLVGEFGLDDVIAPKRFLGPDLFLPLSPFKIAALMTGNYTFVPSSVTKKLLLDVPTDLSGSGVKVAVIDTGIGGPQHPQNLFHIIPYNASLEPDPADRCGHGSWCNYRIGGYSFNSPYGECNGIAPACTLYSIKALNSVGMGTTYEILRAMYVAVQLGVKIVSMSLGSTPQGGYQEDPTAQGVEQMYQNGILTVCAAGNSGPDGSTIDSPGISPHAITVGAWSMMDDAVSYFSSRGPTPDGIVKPDVCSYGGGRKDSSLTPDELIVNGTEGWLDPMYDALFDGWTQLEGTSMATPHMAALLALVEQDRNKQGKTLSIDEIQSILAEKSGQPKTNDSGFGLARLSWFTGY